MWRLDTANARGTIKVVKRTGPKRGIAISRRIVAIVAFAGLVGSGLWAAESRLSAQYAAPEPDPMAWEGAVSVPQDSDEIARIASGPYRQGEEVEVGTKITAADWDREQRVLTRQNQLRQYGEEFAARPLEGRWLGNDMTPVIQRQVPGSEPGLSGTRRILAVSDSFGAASGLSDTDHTWPRRLEYLLNAWTYGGAYQVDVIADHGRNIYSFATWLESGVVESSDPDAIVVSLYFNDTIPNGYEIGTCDGTNKDLVPNGCQSLGGSSLRDYVMCLDGDNGLLSMALHRVLRPQFPSLARWALERHCSVDRMEKTGGEEELRIQEASRDPSQNPFLDRFKEAATRIADAAAGRPVYVLPLMGVESDMEMYKGYKMLLEQAGLRVIYDLDEVKELVTAHPMSKSNYLWANPVDRHFGSVLTTAHAAAAARALFLAIPPKNREGTPATQPTVLATNYLPFNATLEHTSSRVALFGVGDLKSYPGLDRVKDLTPCAATGRPHARLVLNQAHLKGRQVRVTLLASKEPVAVALGGLGTENQETRSDYKAIKPNDTIEFTVKQDQTTIFIGAGRSGCPVTDSWVITPFLVRVEAI